MTDDVTRGEFDLLRQIIGTTQTRLETMDASGTKGVAVVTAQLVDVVKDLASFRNEVSADLTELKTSVDTRFDRLTTDVDRRFDAHAKVHDQDRRDRIAARRWLVGTGIAGMAGMSAVIGLLVDILRHVH